MSRPPNTQQTDVWLHLVKQGGRWSARELTEDGVVTDLPMSAVLQNLQRGGYVQQFQVPGATWRCAFGVTMSCRVPSSVTLRQLIDLGAIQAQPEASA